MKRLSLLIAVLSIACAARAQKVQVALNEHNRYVYYEVVTLNGLPADSLRNNAAAFINAYYAKTGSKKLSDSSASASDKFLIYTSLSLAKHENGQVSYTLHIECRDSKYRYWLSDFVYTPYEKDRYGNFVPIAGKDVALESAASKLDKKEFNNILDQTSAFCMQLGAKLKTFIAQPHLKKRTAGQQPPKVVTDKW